MSADTCQKCLAFLQGSIGNYCAHAAFEDRLGGDYTINGRVLRSAKRPKWCPGFITEADAGIESAKERA